MARVCPDFPIRNLGRLNEVCLSRTQEREAPSACCLHKTESRWAVVALLEAETGGKAKGKKDKRHWRIHTALQEQTQKKAGSKEGRKLPRHSQPAKRDQHTWEVSAGSRDARLTGFSQGTS